MSAISDALTYIVALLVSVALSFFGANDPENKESDRQKDEARVEMQIIDTQATPKENPQSNPQSCATGEKSDAQAGDLEACDSSTDLSTGL